MGDLNKIQHYSFQCCKKNTTAVDDINLANIIPALKFTAVERVSLSHDELLYNVFLSARPRDCEQSSIAYKIFSPATGSPCPDQSISNTCRTQPYGKPYLSPWFHLFSFKPGDRFTFSFFYLIVQRQFPDSTAARNLPLHRTG